MGALGVSLGGMVANLSAGKRGWEDKLPLFQRMGGEGAATERRIAFPRG